MTTSCTGCCARCCIIAPRVRNHQAFFFATLTVLITEVQVLDENSSTRLDCQQIYGELLKKINKT